MLRLLPCIRLLQFVYQATFRCSLSFIGAGLRESTPDWIQSGRLDPIGWKVFKSSCPLEKFMGWCMVMQVSHGVLHGVLNGEVHEECCMGCMLWWMEKWCSGVSAQDGMPGCKIGCRIGPSPKNRCRMEFWTRYKQRGARWSAEICFILYAPFQIYRLGTLIQCHACLIP